MDNPVAQFCEDVFGVLPKFDPCARKAIMENLPEKWAAAADLLKDLTYYELKIQMGIDNDGEDSWNYELNPIDSNMFHFPDDPPVVYNPLSFAQMAQKDIRLTRIQSITVSDRLPVKPKHIISVADFSKTFHDLVVSLMPHPVVLNIQATKLTKANEAIFSPMIAFSRVTDLTLSFLEGQIETTFEAKLASDSLVKLHLCGNWLQKYHDDILKGVKSGKLTDVYVHAPTEFKVTAELFAVFFEQWRESDGTKKLLLAGPCDFTLHDVKSCWEGDEKVKNFDKTLREDTMLFIKTHKMFCLIRPDRSTGVLTLKMASEPDKYVDPEPEVETPEEEEPPKRMKKSKSKSGKCNIA